MPTVLSHVTNQSQSGDPHRSVLGLKLGPMANGATHSPDGYFAHEEAFRSWRPNGTTDSTNIRRRSKGYVGCDESNALQDVQEEEGVANPHPWRRASRHDSRSPCPALNALSNHGYLPRDGREISIWMCIEALREGYGASWVLAIALTVVSFIFIRFKGVGKGWINPTIDLEDLAAHGVLEHHGSLTHADAGEDDPETSSSRSRSTSAASSTVMSKSNPIFLLPLPSIPFLPSLPSLPSLPFIPLLASIPIISHFLPPFLARKPEYIFVSCHPSRSHIRALLADSASGTHLTLMDVARARVRRQATARPTTSRIISQFADGEFAMTLGFLNSGPDPNEPRVELDALREWLVEERLPKGWKPTHEHGLWRVHQDTERVRALMAGIRKYNMKKRNVKSVVYE